MDELVKHCVRELAFEGDLGTDVSRLRQFVADFYALHVSTVQNVDDAYFNFVWSILAQHPSVIVGTVSNQNQPLNFPPQPRKKGRKSKGEDGDDAHQAAPVAQLDPIEDGRTRALDDIVNALGDAVRIAVDPETCFVVMTGSHARSSKLTPLIYATLQLISRQREQGMSVLDIGKSTGYDQKACFYHVKQLCELNLIVKLRRGGNSQNFCVHKYFFENSPLWKKIRSEEQLELQGEAPQKAESASAQARTEESVEDALNFTPIDTRHLTSLNILRSRMVKLLKHSPNQMHIYENIALKIGYNPQSRTDRRFFATRLGELIKEGVIEKVTLPNNNPMTTSTVVVYLRLVSEDAGNISLTNLQTLEDVKDNPEILPVDDDEPDNGLRAMSSLQRQIVDVLDKVGTKGATLNDIASSLGDFDRRTIEHLMTRLERNVPPPHLADQAVVQLFEFYGREKRYRYYTLEHYLAQTEMEQLEDGSGTYGRADVDAAKGFMDTKSSDFYESQEELETFLNNFKSIYWGQSTKAPRKTKTGSKQTRKKQFVNPIQADGTRKRGRPRKDPNAPPKPKKQKNAVVDDTGEGEASRGTKRKASDDLDGDAEVMDVDVGVVHSDVEQKPAKRRGRPPKKRKIEETAELGISVVERTTPPLLPNTIQATAQTDVAPLSVAPKKKRGRPPKNKSATTTGTLGDGEQATTNATSPAEAVDQTPESVGNSHEAEGVRDVITPLHDAVLEASRVGGGSDVRISDAQESAEASPKRSGRIRKPSSRALAMSETALTEKKDKVIMPLLPVVTSHVEMPLSSGIPPPTDQPEAHASNNGMDSVAVLDDPLEDVPLETGPSMNKGSDAKDSTVRTGKKNLSLSRRQNELMRIVEQSNGILNTSRNFIIDEHMKLVESLAKAGEPTSCPVGIRLDRRTLMLTLNSLEEAGRIKVLTASNPVGPVRTTKIVYLPTISEEELLSYLEGFKGYGEGQSLSTTENEQAEVVEGPQSVAQQWFKKYEANFKAHHHWHRNPERFQELYQLPTDVIQEALLMERQTVSQLYGYIPGKLERARALHMHILDLFPNGAQATSEASTRSHIVEWNYLAEELPLSVFCAVVPVPIYRPELKELLDSDDGKNTPISNLPSFLKSIILMGIRLRLYLFDLMTDLETLKLVAPLQRSDSSSEEPTQIQYVDRKGSTIGLNPLLSNWASSVKSTPPLYWKFSTHAPIFLVALVSNPFYGNFDLTTRSNREAFWEELKNTSLDANFANSRERASDQISCDYTSRIVKSLTRHKHWKTTYNFSWYQQEFLRTYIDNTTYRTPCDEENSQELVQYIASVVHAPYLAVQDYFVSFKDEFLRELERKQRKAEIAKRAAERRAETKKFLEEKAEETRKKDMQRWDNMIRRYTKATLSDVQLQRISRLRDSYLQSIQKKTSIWESKIEDVFKVTQSAEIASRAQKLFPSKKARSKVPLAIEQAKEPIVEVPRPAPLELHDFVKSVDEIIQRQKNAFAGHAEGTPTQSQSKGKEKKGKGKSKVEDDKEDSKIDPKNGRRKPRFRWNKEFDELLKDASAIVRSRCKSLHRVDWGALDQIFPYIPRNSARQHLASLKEVPGGEAYLTRLQDCWHELWMRKRGTAELPDADVITASNFDLKTHVAFLRKHLDKNAIRVGNVPEDEKDNFELPANISFMSDTWIISERQDSRGTWDFLWDGAAEEGREKQALEEAFVLEVEEIAPTAKRADRICVAESATKMVFGTPKETYDASVASALLHTVGHGSVQEACKNLLADNVLSKLVRDPNKASPNRALKISEINQAALGGQVAKELFVDAVQLEEAYLNQQEDEWHEWPLLSTDGDTAAILQMVSDHMVEVQFDTSNAQIARQTIDYASKKASDSEIEIRMLVRLYRQTFEPSVEPSNVATPMEVVNDDHRGHALNAYGGKASCKLYSKGLVDCQRCIEDAMVSELQRWTHEDQHLATTVLRIVSDGGDAGVSMTVVLAAMEIACTASQCIALVRAMASLPVPLLYAVGYSDTILVSAMNIGGWAVTLGGESDASPVVKVFPRRWLDISGNRVPEIWDAAVRSVIVFVHSRPGICQAEIQWRLRWLFDRQEVLDVLKYLTVEKYLVPKVAEGGPPAFELASTAEERTICWTINPESHWYQIEGA